MPTWDEFGYAHYRLKCGDFEVNSIDHVVVTRFEDGTSVTAAPESTPEYLQRAHDLDYIGAFDPTTAAWYMCMQHEWLHSRIAEAQGRDFSRVLMYKAHGWKLPDNEAEDEEALVLEVQRLINRGRRGMALLEDWNG